MSLIKKFQQKEFWINVLRIAIPFLLIVVAFSLLYNSGKLILSGDFEAVYQRHFANQKWIGFWLVKVVVSMGYGMYMTNKNMK